MPLVPQRSTRKLTVITRDPSVQLKKRGSQRILRARVDVPDEVPGPEPTGSRVRVIDYDSSSDRFYPPFANGLESEAFYWQD